MGVQMEAQNNQSIKETPDTELMTAEQVFRTESHNTESGTNYYYPRSTSPIFFVEDLHTPHGNKDLRMAPIPKTLDDADTLTVHNDLTMLSTGTSCVNTAVNSSVTCVQGPMANTFLTATAKQFPSHSYGSPVTVFTDMLKEMSPVHV